MTQLPLPFERDASVLVLFLERETNRRVSLALTDNTSTMISCREDGRLIRLRLHRMFLSAGPHVLQDVASFIVKKGPETPHLKAFIDENEYRIKERPRKPPVIRCRGRCHDLRNYYDSLNRQYFDGRVTAKITWGAGSSRRWARRRTLGSYCLDDNLIRINPILDSPRVPRYFLQYVIYHEMLHADIGIHISRGRRVPHSAAFRQREKVFVHYERAVAWEKKRWG